VSQLITITSYTDHHRCIQICKKLFDTFTTVYLICQLYYH